VTDRQIAQLAINTIRTLAIDAIQQANSGHPGTPMGIAPVVYALWQRCLRYDPRDPLWTDRDRFVLSAGHASMLLYAMLHLTGVRAVDGEHRVVDKPSVALDDLRTFRQLGSHCPGHPEYGWTGGVETTTGPLGQGVATSVGMAIALKWLGARYNRPGFDLFTARVYALAGDGCMMEGISSEAASLAGHLQLDNLCWIYDSNHISIEGPTDIAYRDDVAARFRSYGWNVEQVTDANDLTAVESALCAFKRTSDRPTLIIVESHIGYGSPHKMDSAAAHGEPLGQDEVRATKRNYGWPEDARFLVPESVREHFAEGLGERGRKLRSAWTSLFEGYRREFPALAEELDRMHAGELPVGWGDDLPAFPADATGLATRQSSSQVLNAIAKNVPWLVGGSADLSPSTKTRLTLDGAGDFQARSRSGRNIHFGVREHAMAAALNGMSLVNLRAFASGFLIFSDYARGAMRLSALMQLPVIHVLTHDSIAVGEDGPTHQPIEQLANLRSLPGVFVIRPCDANEVVEAWRVIMNQRHGPTALILSRQALPTLDRTTYAPAAGLAHGAYVIAEAPAGRPDVVLLASGSEVALCLQAQGVLAAENIAARVVSVPCWELFDMQPASYRDSVLPPAVRARVSVEAGSTFGWERFVGEHGVSLGMRSFGASAPLEAVQQHFGFTADRIVDAARAQLGRPVRRAA
jgi:transketolase